MFSSNLLHAALVNSIFIVWMYQIKTLQCKNRKYVTFYFHVWVCMVFHVCDSKKYNDFEFTLPISGSQFYHLLAVFLWPIYLTFFFSNCGKTCKIYPLNIYVCSTVNYKHSVVQGSLQLCILYGCMSVNFIPIGLSLTFLSLAACRPSLYFSEFDCVRPSCKWNYATSIHLWWLVSFNTAFSRFIWVVEYDRCHFLWLIFHFIVFAYSLWVDSFLLAICK